MDSELKKLLKKIVKEIYDIELPEITLTVPPKKDLGDFAFACFILAKDLKKNPIEIANKLALELEKSEGIIKSAQVAGPYINIRLNDTLFTDSYVKFCNDSSKNLEQLRKQNSDLNILIDYIGVNVGKPLHIGHICPASQGQVFVNLFNYLGYNVISDSHIGDWGIIFGKLITAFKLWGDEEKLKENAVNHLFELYVKVTAEAEEDESLDSRFRDEFRELSKGNKKSVELWTEFTKYSIASMQEQLGRIGVNPMYNVGESFYEGIGLPKMEDYPDLKHTMEDVVLELIDKKIVVRNEDNSVGVVFPEETHIPSTIIQKKDGTNLYSTSDLATIKYRTDFWDLKKIIYFVDVRQEMHLKQVFAISDMAGWLGSGDKKTEIFHASNGFITLKDGAMSTRKGKIIKLDLLLNEAEDRAKKIILEKRDDLSEEKLNKLSKIIGVGAIKYGYLKKSRDTDVVFDWDEFMSFEGNSGPYIQYAYVRALKILAKIGKNGLKDYDIKSGVEFTHREEVSLAKRIMEFQDVLDEISESYYPHVLAAYAYNLTKDFNAFYNKVNVAAEENENLKELKGLLVYKFSETLKNAFSILAIELPDEM